MLAREERTLNKLTTLRLHKNLAIVLNSTKLYHSKSHLLVVWSMKLFRAQHSLGTLSRCFIVNFITASLKINNLLLGILLAQCRINRYVHPGPVRQFEGGRRTSVLP